jgi:hypothetical protein
MFCDRCGTSLQGAPAFCPACGKAVGQVPLMPVQGRIAGHTRLLGILWIALSAFRLLPGIFLLSFFGRRWSFLPPEVPFFVHGILQTVGALLLASGIVGIMAGWGLLERQTWARMLTIVLGCLNLVDLPFGTALGVYTLWVLLPAQSEAEYRQISRAA